MYNPSIENKPNWLGFTYDSDTETGLLTGTPSNEDASANYAMKIIATDEVGDTSFHEFTIEVSNVNDTPVISNKESIILEATEEELMKVIFPHPTISESLHESILNAYGRSIHI